MAVRVRVSFWRDPEFGDRVHGRRIRRDQCFPESTCARDEVDLIDGRENLAVTDHCRTVTSGNT